MTSTDRLAILKHGLTALNWLEEALRATLPSPTRENRSLLSEIRDVSGLAARLEVAIGEDGADQKSVLARDAVLSLSFRQEDVEYVRALASASKNATAPNRSPLPIHHREALSALAALLARYEAGEFMPPNSYFEPPQAEA